MDGRRGRDAEAAVILVELCAGSAAVAVRWAQAGATPPLYFQGSKRGYADQILSLLGLTPGDFNRGNYVSCADRVVLVEPGPWGEAWGYLKYKEARENIAARLRRLSDEDPRTTWHRLRDAPVPENLDDRVMTWAILQLWSYGAKPVYARDGKWRTAGFAGASVYRADQRARALAAGNVDAHRWAKRSRRLGDLADDILALPLQVNSFETLVCSAEQVQPFGGAVVLIDHPYRGTTCQFGHDLDLDATVRLADQWWRAGSRVAVCEAFPLRQGYLGDSWVAHQLKPAKGFGRTFSKQQSEWCTVSPP